MKINKYPFFLWFTQRREDLILSNDKNSVSSEELGNSQIKRVPSYIIILLKYVPFLFIIPYFYFPKYDSDWTPFIASLIIVPIMFAIYRFNLNLLKVAILFLCVVNIYLVFTIDRYAVSLDIAITFFMELSIIGMILFDIFLFKGYKNWYYLQDFKNEINIKVAQRKEKKFLLFFKKETGINASKKVYVKGYFLRIEDEKN